ncbi:hypothetical protein FA13DRAFT_1745292, partial [Coprinellus micaceus]
MRAGDLDLGAHLPISLAKVVLDFMKSHSRGAEGIYFNVVKICYKFAEAGVMGIIFIDRGLEEAYEYASHILAPWKSEMPGWGRDIHGPHRTTNTRRLYWRPPPVGRQVFEDITNQLERND